MIEPDVAKLAPAVKPPLKMGMEMTALPDVFNCV
jgi:hypothetical protein